MGTVTIDFCPRCGTPAATNGAQITITEGTNFPVPALAFDASTDEAVYYQFRATSYGSGNLTLTLLWYADTGTTGNVVWEACLAAITPDSDSQDIETKAFATASYVQDAHLGTTGQRLHSCAITLSNLDSLAAGDWVALKLARDANGTNATDDLAGDALLVHASLSYSDT